MRESFTYEGILANGFSFSYLGMVLVQDHSPVAVDSFASSSEESDIYILTIGIFTISLMEWRN